MLQIHLFRHLSACALLTWAASLPLAASAWDLSGTRTMTLHARNGDAVKIGTVQFTPQADGRTAFVVTTATENFKDFFLSMKEFKCVEGSGEILCHVPYPYPQPGTVTASSSPDSKESLVRLEVTTSSIWSRAARP